MNITENTTVAEIASVSPASIRLFQQHGIDFCCGGRIPLSQACQERGVPFADLVSAIDNATSTPKPDERDWGVEPLHRLVSYIVEAYHDPLRGELPRLESMASKVARAHSARAAHLTRIEAIVSELSADLRSHMLKEERVLFPAIRAIENGDSTHVLQIDAPIVVMEQEHDYAGTLLQELRRLTDGFVAPEWACATFRGLYHGLSELETTMHVHVHLENNILFPRALASTRTAA